MRWAPAGESGAQHAPGSAVAPRRRGVRTDDQGAVTAEFAIVMPAILVVLGLTIGGILISAHRIALVSLAAQVARLEARGDGDLAASALAEWKASSVEVGRSRHGGLHCVTLRSHPGGGLLAGIGIEALSCAAISGEGIADGVPGDRAVDGGSVGEAPVRSEEKAG